MLRHRLPETIGSGLMLDRHSRPVWSPDGNWRAFGSARGGTRNIYRMRADGSGSVERLPTSERYDRPSDWSPDGQRFVMLQRSGEGASLRQFNVILNCFQELSVRVRLDQ